MSRNVQNTHTTGPTQAPDQDSKERNLTRQASSFFGSLEALQRRSGFEGEQGTITRKYYSHWKGQGLEQPQYPADLRDWLKEVTLLREQGYLIDPDIGAVCMGLGWDTRADVDGSAVLLDAQFRVLDVVWYKNLESNCGSVKHSGDNTTGEGSGDDEIITVNLDRMPLHVHHILFTVCVYTYGVSFDQFAEKVENVYVRMMHGKPKYKQHVMCRYPLTEMSGNALLMGQMTRKGGYWDFRALGTPVTGRSVQEILKKPDSLYCLRDRQSFDPIFRMISVRVTKGTNLAPKDAAGLFRRVASSDPYYIIRYKKKTFASQHKNRTLNPEWNDPAFCLGPVMETERKAIKVSVFDYDAFSADDFMGIVRIPARALYNAGIGEHILSFPLGPSKKKPFRDEDVSGDIHLVVTVAEDTASPATFDKCPQK